jgi:hypothetical protein
VVGGQRSVVGGQWRRLVNTFKYNGIVTGDDYYMII